jgi:hypothetical protein
MDTFVNSLSFVNTNVGGLSSVDTNLDGLSSVDTNFDSLSSDMATLYPDLSTIHQQHIDNANTTIQSLLSSLRQVNAERAAVREEIPVHPYERIKWEHCHRDAEPFDFDSIEVPKDFCPKKIHQALAEISQYHHDNFVKHLEVASLSGFNISEHPHFSNAFAEHVDCKFELDKELPHGKFELDKDYITKHFQFIDMVKSVPLDYIKANPKEFNRRILTKFIEIHQ